jgi:4-amino-4-deoxy-L-arabinose transferase-like glycosyltransferase
MTHVFAGSDPPSRRPLVRGNALRDTLLLLLTLSLLFGFALGSRALWEPDEGRYAEVPREMVVTGDYVTPRLNGVKYFEKPPLFYWLEAGAIKALGANEWSLRLWPALFAILGCLAVYGAGRRFYDRRTGVLAAAVLATNPLYYELGRTVTLDMAVGVMITLALLAFLTGVEQPPGRDRRIYMWACYVFAAFATLTKGLIGFVLPALVIGAWIAAMGEWRQMKKLYLVSGTVLFLVIAVPWHVAVAWVNPEFSYFYFVHEHFLRYLTRVHHRYEPIWFFVPVLLLGLYPWTAFLAQSVKANLPASWAQRHRYSREVFFLLWTALVFAFFSFSSSKLVPYILPLLPPLALLIARYLAYMWEQRQDMRVRTGFWILFVLGVSGGVALALTPHFAPHQKVIAALGWYVYALAAALLLGAIAPFVASRLYGLSAGLSAIVVTSVLFLGTLTLALPQLDSERSVKPLAMALKSRLRPGDEVMTYRAYYQDLPFYLGRLVTVAKWKGELAFGTTVEDTSPWIIDEATAWQRLRGPQTVYVVTERTNLDDLRRHSDGRVRVIAKNGRHILLVNHARLP